MCVCVVGKATEKDLEVLLSERAAKEIYKKWVDTLVVCTYISICTYIHTWICSVCRHTIIVTNVIIPLRIIAFPVIG